MSDESNDSASTEELFKQLNEKITRERSSIESRQQQQQQDDSRGSAAGQMAFMANHPEQRQRGASSSSLSNEQSISSLLAFNLQQQQQQHQQQQQAANIQLQQSQSQLSALADPSSIGATMPVVNLPLHLRNSLDRAISLAAPNPARSISASNPLNLPIHPNFLQQQHFQLQQQLQQLQQQQQQQQSQQLPTQLPPDPGLLRAFGLSPSLETLMGQSSLHIDPTLATTLPNPLPIQQLRPSQQQSSSTTGQFSQPIPMSQSIQGKMGILQQQQQQQQQVGARGLVASSEMSRIVPDVAEAAIFKHQATTNRDDNDNDNNDNDDDEEEEFHKLVSGLSSEHIKPFATMETTTTPTAAASTTTGTSTSTSASTSSSSSNTSSFQEKLYDLIQQAERDGQDDVISWLPDGKAFAIRNQDRFEREVMPKAFKSARMTSFHRQLNLYGFRRYPFDKSILSFYHESFCRGQRHLLANIKRKKRGVPLGEKEGVDDDVAIRRAMGVVHRNRHLLEDKEQHGGRDKGGGGSGSS